MENLRKKLKVEFVKKDLIGLRGLKGLRDLGDLRDLRVVLVTYVNVILALVVKDTVKNIVKKEKH